MTFGQEYFTNTRKIGVEEGLSHYKVLSFYPDEEGMWIGTDAGLNFYNGYNWRYWTKDEGHLKNKTVNFIHKDQDHFLWLFSSSTPGVLVKNSIQSIDILMKERDSILSFQQKFGEQAPFEISDIQNFFEDQEQRIFFFANDHLWRYTPETFFQSIKLPPGFKPHTVFSDGTFTGALREKLALVSATGEVLYASNYPFDIIQSKIIGDRQKFWVSQKDDSVFEFERLSDADYKITLFGIPPECEGLAALLHFDEQRKHLWINKGESVLLFDSKGNLLDQQKGVPRTTCMDHNGNFWTGEYEITLLHLQKKRFKQFLSQDQKKIEIEDLYRCRGITEKEGKLLVNTYLGTMIIDLENEKIQELPTERKRNFVTFEDHTQQIWLANKDLYKLDNSNSRILNTFKIEEPPSKIWSLFEDQENQIWVGSTGLSYLADGKIKDFKKYNDFLELRGALVFFFFKDKNGVVWVGSDNGLYQLDQEKGIISAYGKNRTGAFHLPGNKFQHMHQDAHGVFWLATEDAGLIRWDKGAGKFQQFDKTCGFLTNNIYSVYEDGFGYLWLSSFNGLIRFQKETKDITIYHEEDGISNNEFNRISHYQADDGHIYFGGQNGVTGFHPRDFLHQKSKPEEFKLAIKHISVFGLRIWRDTLSDGSKIDLMNLNPGSRVIDFEIVASDLFWTDKFDLHYSLEPLENPRNLQPAFKEKISSDHHVELFGMHPGTYHLHIKAVHKSGKQLGETIKVPLKISKPIFHTVSFWVCVVLAIGLCIWGFMKSKTVRLRKRQAELEMMVSERTRQILEDQQVIQTQAEQIEVMKDQLNRKDELWLEQFQTIVDERLEDPDLYLPDIITDMDISRSAFYEKVKTLTQMTPNQYIQEIRLTRAKAIIDEGNLKTVKDVAYAIGMKRPSYFSKLFKERFGVLPSAYFRDHNN